MKYTLPTPQALQRHAAAFASLLKPQDIVLLRGELGVGKTSFARYCIRSLLQDPEAEVPSPTFTLIQTYWIPEMGAMLYHMDGYRLIDDFSEGLWEEFGIEEAWSHGVSLIEWPEIVVPYLPQDYIELAFTFADKDARVISYYPHGTWCNRIKELETALTQYNP